MDKDFILNKWVPALRSGEYRQGKGTLRSANDEFCCLGVACDLIDPDAWIDPRDADDDDNYEFDSGDYGLATSFLPRGIGRNIFGDVDRPHDPDVKINEQWSALSNHNDAFDATFDQIADGLEAWVAKQEAVA